MTNHVHHFLVSHDREGFSKLLQVLHRKYATHINKRYQWTGHLWQERFYSSPVEPQSALTVLKYILRNPVAAKMVQVSSDY